MLALKATVANLSALTQEEVRLNAAYAHTHAHTHTHTQLSKLQTLASTLKPIAKTDSTHELTKVQ